MSGDLRPPGGEVEARFLVELHYRDAEVGYASAVVLTVRDPLSLETVARLPLGPHEFVALLSGQGLEMEGAWTSSPMRLGCMRKSVTVDLNVRDADGDHVLEAGVARREAAAMLEKESRQGRVWTAHRVDRWNGGWTMTAYRWDG